MKKMVWIGALLVLLFCGPVRSEDNVTAVLDGIQNRYKSAKAMSVPYTREVITRSMSMLGNQARGDLATGIIYFKPPHFLKLDQEKPKKEIIIADDKTLWWVIPSKKEAHQYPTDTFGKELALLGDIFRGLSQVKDRFKIQLEKPDEKGNHQLVLLPDPPWQEIDRILLTITPDHEIQTVNIINTLGGTTRFNLGKTDLEKTLDSQFFKFSPPEGYRVIYEQGD